MTMQALLYTALEKGGMRDVAIWWQLRVHRNDLFRRFETQAMIDRVHQIAAGLITNVQNAQQLCHRGSAQLVST